MEAAVEEAENLKGKLAGFKHSYEQVQKELQVATALPRHGIATSHDTPRALTLTWPRYCPIFFIKKKIVPTSRHCTTPATPCEQEVAMTWPVIATSLSQASELQACAMPFWLTCLPYMCALCLRDIAGGGGGSGNAGL
jgi:hypothetical protein